MKVYILTDLLGILMNKYTAKGIFYKDLSFFV